MPVTSRAKQKNESQGVWKKSACYFRTALFGRIVLISRTYSSITQQKRTSSTSKTAFHCVYRPRTFIHRTQSECLYEVNVLGTQKKKKREREEKKWDEFLSNDQKS